jgi:Xaa-Pro aminopeptidase
MKSNDYQDRIKRVAASLTSSGDEFIFVTPGADLRYLTGYDALPLERLTCLAIKADGQAWMIVPTLERPSAEAHQVTDLGINLLDWQEIQNPYELLIAATGKPKRALVNNLMWVEKAFGLRDAIGTEVSLAGNTLSDIRVVKSKQETQWLLEAGAAIDEVHNQIGKWLKPGRTEREVGRDIAEAILASGHSTVDFVIVGSGPNGASPHHELSDRVIQQGEPVVIDIGGTMPSGYCSDSTRMYACGSVPSEYLEHYEVLQRAQSAASAHAKPGVTCESVDKAARDILIAGNLGDQFIHRTGHGIGMETHEDPYIVTGNKTQLVPGHAFSIEPGFYFAGKYGARIEDIVVCTEDGIVCANNTTRDLVIF